MSNWFSPYPRLDWRPDNKYSALWADSVGLLSENLFTQRHRVGFHVTTGKWKALDLQGGRYYILTETFDFSGYERRHEWILIFFKLQIRIARQPDGGDEIYHGTLTIDFPADYPQHPPLFKLDDPEFGQGGAHAHHVMGGHMCILAEDKDWQPNPLPGRDVSEVDNVWSATLAALDWIVWHHNEFGNL